MGKKTQQNTTIILEDFSYSDKWHKSRIFRSVAADRVYSGCPQHNPAKPHLAALSESLVSENKDKRQGMHKSENGGSNK